MVVILCAIALLVPGWRTIAGLFLLSTGTLMILGGYCVGAYSAFREDAIYGILYLTIPLYTAYYLVTRWEDLWPFVTVMTAGAAIASLALWILEPAAAAEAPPDESHAAAQGEWAPGVVRLV